MKTEAEREIEIKNMLPAWFVPRMMGDEWYFGLLLSTGKVLAVSSIADVHQGSDGSVWIDVNMLADDPWGPGVLKGMWADNYIIAPTSRTRASVNAAHVVMAVELADT